MLRIQLLVFSILILLNACSKDGNEIKVISEDRQDLEMISAYLEGMESLNSGDPYFAAKKFLEAELLFPQSEWAPRSSLMASYSYYMQNFYAEALSNLERYIKITHLIKSYFEFIILESFTNSQISYNFS